MKKLKIVLTSVFFLFLANSCNKDWLDYSAIDMYSAKIDIDDSNAPHFLHVAAASIQPHKTDKTQTLSSIELLVEKIKQEKPEVQVIVFPELALEWYWTDETPETYQRSMAESIPGASTNYIKILAMDNSVTIVFGMTEIDENTGKLYNSQVLIRPDGELIKYRKRNLNDADLENGMTAGENGLVTTTIGDAQCALFICSDMQSKSITNEVAESGIDVILHSLTSSTDFNQDISYVGMQMNKWIVFANRFGDEGISDYTGFIQIINPNGGISEYAVGKDIYVYRKIGIY